MDLRFGEDMYESFVRYQSRLIRVFDSMAEPYDFTVVDAGRPAEAVFQTIQEEITSVFKRPAEPGSPASRKPTGH